MKFFADTANIDEIDYCFSRGINDGITTNPKIMETTGDLSLGFEGASKKILSRFPSVPVSLETDLRGIDVSKMDELLPEAVRDTLLKQAYEISGWGPNVVVKIPISQGGVLATEALYEQGIKTNVTACMTPDQALSAAEAGATYVSLFANRMLDSYILELAGHKLEEILSGPEWKNAVKENKDKYFEKAWSLVLNDIAYVANQLDGSESELIIGSIRLPEDIHRIVSAGPQVITIPTGIARGLDNPAYLKKSPRTFNSREFNARKGLSHPMTQYTIEEFERAANSYRK